MRQQKQLAPIRWPLRHKAHWSLLQARWVPTNVTGSRRWPKDTLRIPQRRSTHSRACLPLHSLALAFTAAGAPPKNSDPATERASLFLTQLKPIFSHSSLASSVPFLPPTTTLTLSPSHPHLTNPHPPSSSSYPQDISSFLGLSLKILRVLRRELQAPTLFVPEKFLEASVFHFFLLLHFLSLSSDGISFLSPSFILECDSSSIDLRRPRVLKTWFSL